VIVREYRQQFGTVDMSKRDARPLRKISVERRKFPMAEQFSGYLASRRLTRRSVIFSFAVAAVGSAVVSCAGGSQSAQPAAAPAAPAAPAAAVNPPAAPQVAPTATAAPAPTAQPAPTNTPAPAVAATPTIVNMTDQYKFDPAALTIPKGTTVEWKNGGTQPHTITFDPAKAMNKSNVALPAGVTPFDSGLINAGASYKYTFAVAGDYKYICIPHEAMGMIGTIKVT
jgi:plastocyanin